MKSIKRMLALLLMLATLLPVGSAMADFYVHVGDAWFHCDDYGYIIERVHTTPLSWDTLMANHHFPKAVVRDTADLREAYGGQAVGSLAITSNRGSNLRVYPTIEGSYYLSRGRVTYQHESIIRKLHANVTVFVNFRLWDNTGREWYHVTCSDGQEGFVAASRMMLVR